MRQCHQSNYVLHKILEMCKAMTNDVYRELEESIDDWNCWNLSNDCDIQKIPELKKRSDRIRDAFDKGKITTEERNRLDEFVWKIIDQFNENCVCKIYNPECDPEWGLSK